MAYKEELPQMNLEAVDIRDTIGCLSNNLADYCVKAKKGGIGGYAFQIVENGYQPSDGYLITGATPYFNIWSQNSPAELVANNAADKYPKFRLKRNTYGDIAVNGKVFNANSYCFDLGTFRGYKQRTKPPVVGKVVYSVDQDYIFMSGLIYGFYLGDYDWRWLLKNQYGYSDTSNLYIVFIGTNGFPKVSLKLDDIKPNQEIIASIPDNHASYFTLSITIEDRQGGSSRTVCYLPFEQDINDNTGGQYEHLISARTDITPVLKEPNVRSIVFDKPEVLITRRKIQSGYYSDNKRTLAYIGFDAPADFNLDRYSNSKCSFTNNGVRYTNIPVQLRPGDWIYGFDSGGQYMVIFEYYGLIVSYDNNITLLITPN